MSFESQKAMVVDFSPRCMVEVMDLNNGSESDAIQLIDGTMGIEGSMRGLDGETRRLLICARCSLIAWIEHDDNFGLVGIQPVEEIRSQCRSTEQPWEKSEL